LYEEPLLTFLINVMPSRGYLYLFMVYEYLVTVSSSDIIFPVGLYERKTWSLILREEYRQRLLENRVLRGMLKAGNGRLGGCQVVWKWWR
jgi:hypothetical protein